MTQTVRSFVRPKLIWMYYLNVLQEFFQTQWEVIVSYLFQLTMGYSQPTQAINGMMVSVL